MSEPIKCTCTVYKVQTLVDHGLRVSFDMPESEIMAAAMFMECQRMAVILNVEATPIEQNDVGGVEGKKGRPDIKSLRGS